MKEKIIEKIKHSNLLGFIYVKIMTIIYECLDFFTKTDSKTIIFTSFSGRQYSDSPRVIYESLKNDPNFSNYRLIWAFRNPLDFPEIATEDKVEINSVGFLIKLFKSKYWVSNASIERLIPTRHKKHIYINTWHGVPLKHLGPDEEKLEYIVKNWFKNVKFDLLTASGEYDKKIFQKIFPNTKEILPIGLPRNQQLISENVNKDKIKKNLIEELSLDTNKKILLYAPTFREYDLNGISNDNRFFDKSFLTELSKKYNVLIRSHYFAEINDIDDLNIVNVSNYDELNKLMIASDILITDYSSLMFDYLNLAKPVVLYTYDLKKYIEYRGTYFSPEEYFTVIEKIDDLLDSIEQARPLDTSITIKFNNDNKSIEYVKNYIQIEEL